MTLDWDVRLFMLAVKAQLAVPSWVLGAADVAVLLPKLGVAREAGAYVSIHPLMTSSYSGDGKQPIRTGS